MKKDFIDHPDAPHEISHYFTGEKATTSSHEISHYFTGGKATTSSREISHYFTVGDADGSANGKAGRMGLSDERVADVTAGHDMCACGSELAAEV